MEDFDKINKMFTLMIIEKEFVFHKCDECGRIVSLVEYSDKKEPTLTDFDIAGRKIECKDHITYDLFFSRHTVENVAVPVGNHIWKDTQSNLFLNKRKN